MENSLAIRQHYFSDMVKSPYFGLLSPFIVGEMLYEYRQALGVTKQQLTKNSGILTVRDISLIECGRESRPFYWKKYITLLINYSNQLKF